MREVLRRVDLRFKTNLGSSRGFPTNFLKTSIRKTRIGCLTIIHKTQEVEIHIAKNILVPSELRSIGVIV